jgi:SHS2 domain-containing protein
MRIFIEASDKISLYEAALEGMNKVIQKDFCEKTTEFPKVATICIHSEDETMLLIDFLSAVLSLSHLKKCIFCRVTFTEISATGLDAVLYGAKTTGFDRDVKAVTYHEAEITRNERGNYQTVVIFDI